MKGVREPREMQEQGSRLDIELRTYALCIFMYQSVLLNRDCYWGHIWAFWYSVTLVSRAYILKDFPWLSTV